MTTFNNNQAYVEDTRIISGAVGDISATTTICKSTTTTTDATSVGGVTNIVSFFWIVKYSNVCVVKYLPVGCKVIDKFCQ